MVRKCPRCGEAFPLTEEFWTPSKANKNGFNTYCKACRKAIGREWVENNRERHNARTERNRLKYRKVNTESGVPVTIKSEKLCRSCNTVYPLTTEYWNVDNSNPTGFNSKCRECSKEAQNNWLRNNKEKRTKYGKDFRAKNAEKRKQAYFDFKYEVLSFYSTKDFPECICCGETNLNALCLDHINGGGNKHRKDMNIKNMLWWVKKNNYPNIFQVLCANCNLVKHITGVSCHN